MNAILFLFVFLIVLYFFLFSNLFKITTVEYEGPASFDPTVLKEVVNSQLGKKKFFVPQSHILFFDADAVYQSLGDYSVLSSLRIEKKPFKTLVVHYRARVPAFSIYSKNLYWIADKEGYILSVSDSWDNGLPLVYDTYRDYRINEYAPFRPYMEKLMLVWSDFFTRYSKDNLVLTRIQFTQKADDIELVTNEGWKIILDLQNDVAKQLFVLDRIIKQKIPDRSNLQYIDLRIDDWVYYK